ncbi:nucleotidyltransferase family protein [Clostridium putrefaciens]|uniref:Nucleotidyltransferase family protein n=1 Tax=Clostridium putrefaciens TaxID=99675 RepID=A0A381JCM3_9CLOT|nr:aminoglycoside adenylyltransferase domain-containing protein [Clostridium putrefaciens]SUY48176.1 nucleotidyltransferase family protein [Clostridium putrefaciens]
MESQELLDKLVEYSCRIFENNLVGIYLHGSMAMGCFNAMKSDIDILVVVENVITDLQKKIFMDIIVALNDNAPAKGIEMSLVRSEYCKNFVYPTPFDLHFSTMRLNWYKSDYKDYIEKMNGTDHDLAAHFVITKNRGIVLYGKAISDVFGEIPAETYFDSIKSDISDSQDEVIDNPIYIILNLCRVLAYEKDKLVLSKKEGGEWGIKNIDGIYQGLIKEALACYSSDQDMILNHSLALEYCKYMKNKIGLRE